MISNHYPMTYGHEYGWMILAVIGFISAYARHFFNLRNKGINKPIILVVAAIMLAALAAVIAPHKIEGGDRQTVITDDQAMVIVQQLEHMIHNTRFLRSEFM